MIVEFLSGKGFVKTFVMSYSDSDSDSDNNSSEENIIEPNKPEYDPIYQLLLDNASKIQQHLADSINEWSENGSLTTSTMAPIEAERYIVVYVVEGEYEKLYIIDYRSISKLWLQFYTNIIAGFQLAAKKMDGNEMKLDLSWGKKKAFGCNTFEYKDILTYWDLPLQ